MPASPNPASRRVPIWGGIEATVNRVGDKYYDQFEWSGHPERLDDLDRIAELGICALRVPVLWERVMPGTPEEADWSYPDSALSRLRELSVSPIVGLVHHGSGPAHTNLLDPGFPEKLAEYAGIVAQRYPWIDAYTPVNEPLTTARFSALYGHWFPHATDELSFVRALLIQVRAVVLSMAEIRKANPAARLVQTDDLGKVHATPPLQYQADFENERRWLTWDLLCGRLKPGHRMWDHFRWLGIDEAELAWFSANPCPPDVVGVNYYVTSERVLDHRLDLYPPETHGGNGRDAYVDVVAARVREEGCDGAESILSEAWERYRLPVAITECHLGCTREEQVRWLVDAWAGANRLRDRGAEVAGFTVWSLFGAFDWDSLLTRWRGHYEPGAFDLRGPSPRPTALAEAVRSIAHGRMPSHPVLAGRGWWEREFRLEHLPVSAGTRTTRGRELFGFERPILIVGAGGAIARALVVACQERGLAYSAIGHPNLDRIDGSTFEEAFYELHPWAVVDATDPEHRKGVEDAVRLAAACARAGSHLVTLSSDRVFDGSKGDPYVEDDAANPDDANGRILLDIEQRVPGVCPQSLIVRTSTLFGPWDYEGLLSRSLFSLARGETDLPMLDRIVTPTYIPDLVHAVLDLLVDGEVGRWHLTNAGSVALADLVEEIACSADLTVPRLRSTPAKTVALISGRGAMLPDWKTTIDRYVADLAPRIGAIKRFSWV